MAGQTTKPEPTPQLGLRERMVAAAGASVLSACVVNPLDVLKVRMQAQAVDLSPSPVHPGAPCRTLLRRSRLFSFPSYVCTAANTMTSSRRTAPDLISHGSKPTLASSSAWRTLRSWFGTQQTARVCMCAMPGGYIQLQVKDSAASGINATNNSIASQQCGAATRPGSVRLPSPGMLTTLRSIVNKEGVAGLWRGLDSALLMSVPTVLMYYPLYDAIMACFSSNVSTPTTVAAASCNKSDSIGWQQAAIEGPESRAESATNMDLNFQHSMSGATSTSTSSSTVSALKPAMAGAAARTVTVLTVAPFEYIRTRQQAFTGTNTAGTSLSHTNTQSAWQVLRSSLLEAAHQSKSKTQHTQQGARMLGNETVSLIRGLPSLWTGLGATIARDVPFSALYWALVEPIRAALLEQPHYASVQVSSDDLLSTAMSTPTHVQLLTANLIAGSIAGAAAAAITTPFDVVKTRVQLAAASSSGMPGVAGVASHAVYGNTQRSTMGVMRRIVAEQGVSGLFVGVGPRALRCAPACAIVIGSYEVLKSVLSHP